MVTYILIGIIILMVLPALVGLDEMITSWRLSRWYEKKDRQHKLIKKLKEDQK